MKSMFLIFLCCTSFILAEDTKPNTPHDALKLGIKLLKAEDYEEFYQKMFTDEVHQIPEARRKGSYKKILSEKKDVLLKRFQTALKIQPQFGTYDKQKAAYFPFAQQAKDKMGFILLLENQHYKFGLSETVGQSTLNHVAFD
ncbi:hypothetical protein [uncultured Gimesia sp.]|uniref:hypothetical protein n=1 Tax=uncultured Gimesia sp. TaxID=1678688 RepID=UPI0030D88FF3|tara:strand:- start:13762 stop:14187 length:426 start_codon:yes stop_codon:yes gene_type:complete